MKKNLFVRDVKPDNRVDSLFLIENADLKTGKKGKYLTCTLSDSTGKIPCKIWGRYNGGDQEIEYIYKSLFENAGCVFRISGKADSYNEEIYVSINEGIEYLKNPAESKGINEGDFLFSPADIEGNKKEILHLSESISDEGLRNIVISVLKKTDGFFEKPAAKSKHHDYPGGLCEHTLEVAKISVSISEGISGSNLNRDILIAGAILHDIGKCMNFDRKGLSFQANSLYSLLGHITPALQMLSRYEAFTDKETFGELMHIIQSHHGDYGDIRPQTPEAWAVHFADNISATIHEVKSDLEQVPKGTSTWGKRIEGYVYKSANEPKERATPKPQKHIPNQKSINQFF
ncbi:HD domain-containing protein [Methanoplanus sp. FWC-SCC4]|uniref:HD domain-containing protein n=1 Tax=Methanochimaera problematica TaxID=2609417 RepID=A0AA97F9M1_9EURY|nr:HD domain-containing protein [Methanoplanus sp. FWC-SCC4]WOF15365.1 HD domain-containing protein [Methanoplanus sp. FWC-SCC4]